MIGKKFSRLSETIFALVTPPYFVGRGHPFYYSWHTLLYAGY